ncbi:MAG TPA: 5'-nucleotidase domain-containing protein, partial [Labilithrix sp.]|nr:5'-nucleotidase domain-containing protein [Labilithrix sp.]
DSAWRTVMIMQELETEIAAYESCKDDFGAIEVLDDQREHLEDDLRYYQARIKELTRTIEHAGGGRARNDGSSRDLAAVAAASVAPVVAERPAPGTSTPELEADRMRFKRAVERIRGKLRQIDAEITAMERRIDLRFHPYWGSLLKEGAEQSSFGKQVDDYACLYTSRVSNFLAYSPQQTFRSPRDVMAHEIGM